MDDEALAPLRHLERARTTPLKDRFSIVSLHPSAPMDYLALEAFTARFPLANSFIHLFRADSTLVLQSADNRYLSADDLSARSESLLLVYDPRVVEADHGSPLYGFIDEAFQLCEQSAQADVMVKFYVKRAYPCQLLLSTAPLKVSYDSGMQLDNLHYELNDRALDLYLLWSYVPDEVSAFSLQLFDEAGAKAFGQDFIIYPEPEFHHRYQLQALESGEYSARIIVYDYETGVSVPGAIRRSGASANRAIEFARLTLD